MATLHPFRALRPTAEKAAEIACVPYDVINMAEARDLAHGNPLSFLHVIRPEIDFPAGTNEYSDEVYKRGAQNLDAYADADDSLVEEEASVYVYRLIMDGRSQCGVFGCVSVRDYDEDVILKHELTRPTKEDDRTRHILEQQAHAEPVMLTYKDDSKVADIISATTETEPIYDLRASDGIQHTIWRVEAVDVLVDAFAGIHNLYVADGHHRCKAASRAFEEVTREQAVSDAGSEEAAFFPAVMFPMCDMKILAYNRIIRTVPGSPREFLEELGRQFDLSSTEDASPQKAGDVCVYLCGQWSRLTLPTVESGSVVEQLDVGRLSAFVLQPLLGISDPRTDLNIDFVGGIRGTKELERLVDSGKAEMAISMFPTSIEELIEVSDAHLLMPPKSTWFEPKLRSGFLVHQF